MAILRGSSEGYAVSTFPRDAGQIPRVGMEAVRLIERLAVRDPSVIMAMERHIDALRENFFVGGQIFESQLGHQRQHLRRDAAFTGPQPARAATEQTFVLLDCAAELLAGVVDQRHSSSRKARSRHRIVG